MSKVIAAVLSWQNPCCLRLAASARDASARSDLYRARGHAHHVLGDFEAALQDYTQALAAARMRKSRAASQLGRPVRIAGSCYNPRQSERRLQGGVSGYLAVV